MKKLFLTLVYLLSFTFLPAQAIIQRLEKAWQHFEADSQMRHAISSLYVIDAVSGEVVFDKNSAIGLAPASTQKIITSASAFELLGKDFRYSTQLGLEKYQGRIILHIYAMGDPTLGSWRWEKTREEEVLKKWTSAIEDAAIKKVDEIYFETNGWNTETIPDGWIWQDIGNYYGAGASVFNWRENQYDIILRSGEKIGQRVEVVKTIPVIYDLKLESNLSSAEKGSGDNAYVYYPLRSGTGVIRGTIPINESNFKISAALINPFQQFLSTWIDTLKKRGISVVKDFRVSRMDSEPRDISILADNLSPSLDSIIYWFNKKSINLYGEALIKTLAVKKTGVAVTDTGVAAIKNFWKEKGIHPDELNIYDGSGLSPLNRVTTHAQVSILRYAKDKEWFNAFYDALPEYNGMKMKSGTISDVKGFCGYQTSKEGRQYIFSFLVNNYGGRTTPMVNKMYKVLDELK